MYFLAFLSGYTHWMTKETILLMRTELTIQVHLGVGVLGCIIISDVSNGTVTKVNMGVPEVKFAFSSLIWK